MVTIDLITGFLGCGKTTFLERYAAYWKKKGANICILENDYGAVNVDMMLLGHLEGENCGLEMVAGGCDYDCHRRRFKTKLIAMGMLGYDRVLVEPSGIFDVDEFFDVLYEEPLDRWYQAGSVIAIVDGGLEDTLSPQSEYLLASETAKAGVVLLSKTQLCQREELAHTVAHLNRAMEQAGCSRRFGGDVVEKPWDCFTDADFQRIASAGYVHASFRKLPIHDDNAYQSLYYMNLPAAPESLRERVEAVMNDPACGRVFRVKGFVPLPEGGWLELNSTKRNVSLKPIARGQEIIIVIGEELNQAAVDAHMGGRSVTA
jgi:G3E family GTPase